MQKELFPNWRETVDQLGIERQAYQPSQTPLKPVGGVGRSPRPVIDVNKNGIQIDMLKTGVK